MADSTTLHALEAKCYDLEYRFQQEGDNSVHEELCTTYLILGDALSEIGRELESRVCRRLGKLDIMQMRESL